MAIRKRNVEVYRNGKLVETRTEEYEVLAQEENYETLQSRLRQAMQANRTYLSLASPTAAQTNAQVKAVTRQIQAVIRILLAELDETE